VDFDDAHLHQRDDAFNRVGNEVLTDFGLFPASKAFGPHCLACFR
jgi:hypothetical protein